MLERSLPARSGLRRAPAAARRPSAAARRPSAAVRRPSAADARRRVVLSSLVSSQMGYFICKILILLEPSGGRGLKHLAFTQVSNPTPLNGQDPGLSTD